MRRTFFNNKISVSSILDKKIVVNNLGKGGRCTLGDVVSINTKEVSYYLITEGCHTTLHLTRNGV